MKRALDPFDAGVLPDRTVGHPDNAAADAPSDADAAGAGDGPGRSRWRKLTERPAAAHLGLFAVYLLAGIAVTWPRASLLVRGELPQVSDVASYVWSLWWVAHQVAHLGNPWFTRYMAAPVGIRLGFDTLMPLPGLIMTPVTLLFGPSAAFSLLTIVVPGLLCYVMYRAARLWLGQLGAIAAGGFFGLSSMLAWQNWYHLNISIGTVFLPLTLEASVRLVRSPGWRRGLALGVVIAAAVLTNQESAVAAALLAVAVVAPWLVMSAVRARRTADGLADGLAGLRTRLGAVGIAVAAAIVVSSPQLAAMAQQAAGGGAQVQPRVLASTYGLYGVGIPTLFAPSPRLDHWQVGSFRLAELAMHYTYGEPQEAVATFGIVLTLLALAGLALTWRRRSSWWLALLWGGGAALALGTKLTIGSTTYLPLRAIWHGVPVSELLPYTWLIRVPGLSALREADRLALLGLVGAAVLAGAAVEWLSRRTWPALRIPVLSVVLIAGLLEAGWSGIGGTLMATTMPRLDGPIAADHSGSIVVDVGFGLRGGIPLRGFAIPTRALVLATEDGHPRAVSYTSWVPDSTSRGILTEHEFYHCLDMSQFNIAHLCGGWRLAAARRDLRTLHIGWVLVWPSKYTRKPIRIFLRSTGFHLVYRAEKVAVWRPGPARLGGR